MTFKITCKSRKVVHDLLELGAAFLKLKIVPLQHFLCDSRMEKIMLWANTLLRIWYTLYVYGTKIQFGRAGEFDFADGRKYFVNDIWNKSYMNCGNEMKMKKWSPPWTQFM